MNPRAARLVAGREIREQARGKALWISTAIFVVAIVLVIVLPAELRGGRPTYHVTVASPAPSGAVAAIRAAGPAVGAHVVVTTVADNAAATEALRAKGPGRADIAVLAGASPRVMVDRAAPAASTSTETLLTDDIARQVAVERAIARSGLPPARARALAAPAPLPIGHLRPAPVSTSGRLIGLGTAILFLILVQRYGFGLLMGVIHEKSGRVIEILLSTLRPVELLAGKVAGSGVIVLAQAAVFTVVALVSAETVGSHVLSGSGVGTIVESFVWIVIGFFFYATLFAAAGSLASKPEDAQSVGLPLQLPIFVGYFLAFTALGSGSINSVVRVLAYLPPTAPLDMPVLTAAGGAGPLQVAISMAICVAGTVVVARVGAGIFARSILHTGRRLKVREALRDQPAPSRAITTPASR